MSSEIGNNVDWTAAATPPGEQYGPGLSRKSRQAAAPTAYAPPATRHGVLEKLLGQNNLAAHDVSGNDPYNATGKQFRR
jgi:hypothetical protein